MHQNYSATSVNVLLHAAEKAICNTSATPELYAASAGKFSAPSVITWRQCRPLSRGEMKPYGVGWSWPRPPLRNTLHRPDGVECHVRTYSAKGRISYMVRLYTNRCFCYIEECLLQQRPLEHGSASHPRCHKFRGQSQRVKVPLGIFALQLHA